MPQLIIAHELSICAGIVAAATCVCPALLAAIGFGPGGIIAGSIAAAIQSCIGNVAAGSLFATLQSLGAGGFAMFSSTTFGAAIGAIIGCFAKLCGY